MWVGGGCLQVQIGLKVRQVLVRVTFVDAYIRKESGRHVERIMLYCFFDPFNGVEGQLFSVLVSLHVYRDVLFAVRLGELIEQ